MRMMMQVELDTQTANPLIGDGRIKDVLDGIMSRMKPEAAYFYARGGRRAFTLVVDAPDSASIPSLAEPFWQEVNASVEMFPCMNAEELQEGISRLG